MHRVVITGVGIVSVLGSQRERVAEALYGGYSGIIYDEERQKRGFRSALTGHIADFDEERHCSRKQRKNMPSFVVQAYAAVMDALEHADIEPKMLRSERCGLIFSNDSCIKSSIEQADALREAGVTTAMGSGHVFRCMNSTISMNLNVLLGNLGGTWTVSAACASATMAIGQAADAIRLGRQDRIICGGAQELHWEALAAFDGLSAFSTHPIPEEASRPFDAARDGLVPSGGAAALVLESYEEARQRGAKILGEIRGFGCAADGYSLSNPNGEGLARAIRLSLNDARLLPADVTIVNAHATSTPIGDAAEADALSAVFGKACPPVVALKSMTGHELWMSGAAQVVYSVLMAERGFTAATRNFTNPDAHSAHLPILTRTLNQAPRTMLCNAAGFGGTNACLVVDFS